MELELTSRSLSQTLSLGRIIGQSVQGGDVLSLIGDLGAGKTQFVRGLAQGMQLDDSAVASPTFVMAVEHRSAIPHRPVLVHIDAYRINSLDDLETIGWTASEDASLAEFRRGAVLAVEWADRLEGLMVPDRLEIRLAHSSDNDQHRTLRFRGIGDWASRLATLAHELQRVASESSSKTQCPICRTIVPGSAPSFPFCSPRCRTIDLGRWIDGRYTISRPIETPDLEEE